MAFVCLWIGSNAASCAGLGRWCKLRHVRAAGISQLGDVYALDKGKALFALMWQVAGQPICVPAVLGCAKRNSSVNRAQVRDGRALLARVLPVMLDNPARFDGRPFYPAAQS